MDEVMQKLNDLRHRVLRGDPVTDTELADGVRLLRKDRFAAAPKPKAPSTRKSKIVPDSPLLSDPAPKEDSDG